MPGKLFVTCCAAAAIGLFASPMAEARAPDTYEDLYRVKAKHFDLAYLLAGADFRTYTKVMLDTPEVAFERNWVRDYNSSMRGAGSRISDSDAQSILDDARTGLTEIYAKAFTEGGYTLTTTPGPDVLRVKVAVINLSINAPDTMSPGRSVSFSEEAGRAKLVIEARDSLSGALLGRAIDSRTIGDGPTYRRNSVTNRADFSREFAQWAKVSVQAIDELKELSPINSEGETSR